MDTTKYKVFLVEDEIITREGIRDNVNWNAAGFEFCGEASDGEMALQYIQDARPDVVITDIKMPFMDGLELSKLIHERMPWIKVIILSGHDEFEYAQSAVKLGVFEYILKPISAQEIHEILLRVAKELEQERSKNEQLNQLKNKVEESLALSREKFLMDLVMGVISSATAIEQSQQLGMRIIAKCYMVAVMRFEFCDPSQAFDYRNYHIVEQIVSEFTNENLGVYLTKIGFELLVFFFKGDSQEQLMEEGVFLLELIQNKIQQQIECNIKFELGSIQDRLGNVHLSFLDAMVEANTSVATDHQTLIIEDTSFVHIDHQKIENFLKFGGMDEFDSFFEQALRSVAEAALQSDLMKQHLYVDLFISTNQFLRTLGEEDISLSSFADLTEIDDVLGRTDNIDQMMENTKSIFLKVLRIRDQHTNPERIHFLYQIIAYLENHFEDPGLKMNEVAERFNLSASYFSTIFHQEIGETFRDYISNLRIQKAKALLRTSNLKVMEIAYRCGYSDPHYFSTVFKKNTGQSPQQFRDKSLHGENEE